MTATDAGRPVTVVKRRWETSTTDTFVFEATVIEEDDRGVWFRTEPLAFHRDSAGRIVYIATHAWLGLVPRDRMWLAMFAGGNWKVDVCLPPVLSHDTIDFCDLELDVTVATHPSVHNLRIVDHEEFEALGLPNDLSATCLRTAEDVRSLIADRRAPFDAHLDARIADVVESDPRVAAGPLVRSGWMAQPGPHLRDLVRDRFGDGVVARLGPNSIVGGALGRVHVAVDEGEVVAVDSSDEAVDRGLQMLVDLTLEANEKLLRELDALASGV